ncbi:ASIC5 [Mytilus coruscus]|uniref:ASIC5 n=1 Tax=Mytilus coruscus TaxID=42192 RepID=A0A6J8DC00_MYTCO|nr:ASIC5 [Mytilus coruscus]
MKIAIMNETGEQMMAKEDKKQNDEDSYSEKEIWTNFTQTTGFHGLNKITFERNNPRQLIRSICWIIVWLICAVFLIYTVVVELKNYYNYPTISNTYIQLEEQLSFPAVTICNLSPRSSQGIKKDAKTNNLYMATSALFMYSQNINWSDPFYEQEGYFAATTKKDVYTSSKNVWESVYYSLFDNNHVQQKDGFSPVYTDIGLCLRFNSDGSQYTTMYGAMFNLQLHVNVMTYFDYFSHSLSSGVKACWNEIIQNKCGCTDFLSKGHLLITYHKETCDCPQACQYTAYDFSFSTGTYPSEFFVSQISEITGYPEWTNFALIRIYFKDLSITMTEQVAKYENAGDIFANLGGQLGLFLGASILTITELLEVAFVCWWLSSWNTYTSGCLPGILTLVGVFQEYLHWWLSSWNTYTGGCLPGILTLVGVFLEYLHWWLSSWNTYTSGCLPGIPNWWLSSWNTYTGVCLPKINTLVVVFM